MIDVLNNIAEIHKNNSKPSARDYELCERNANLCKLLVIGISIGLGATAFVFQLPAFLDYLTKGIIRPSYNIYLPGFDKTDARDMSVLMLINIAISLFEILIISSSDTFVAINFSSIPLFSSIIQQQINEFKFESKDKGKQSGINSISIKEQLIKIILMQIKYNE